MAEESERDQLAGLEHAIGSTAEDVESMYQAGMLSAEAADRILVSLRGSGLAIDGPIPTTGPGAAMIRAERLRQVAVEGYDGEHDAEHDDGQLSRASLAYVLSAAGFRMLALPFDGGFKPGPKPLDDLVKAGALALAEADRIAAEIDRIVAEEAKREH